MDFWVVIIHQFCAFDSKHLPFLILWPSYDPVIDVVQVFLLLTCLLLIYFTPFSSVSIVDFEQVNVS